MDNDDELKGRILNRREMLALLGMTSVGLLAACAPRTAATAMPATVAPAASPTEVPATPAPTSAPAAISPTATLAEAAAATTAPVSVAALPACIISPELTEGPLFVEENLNRSDIRPDTSNGLVVEGAPLDLTLIVGQVSGEGCVPLAGATVDIWHCDAQGIYSDTSELGMQTVGQKFLRGSQVSDATGAVKFITIYPGWYNGRAVHIHIKVRGNTAAGQGYEFTSQLFFDDALSDTVFAQAPYTKSGQRILNNRDNIYGQGGGQTVLDVKASGSGYASSFYMGVKV